MGNFYVSEGAYHVKQGSPGITNDGKRRRNEYNQYDYRNPKSTPQKECQCRNSERCNCSYNHDCNCHAHCGCNYNQMKGLKGIEVEYTGTDIMVEPGKSVPFNKQILRASSQIALADNGKVIIAASGIYHVQWWVEVEGVQGGKDTYVGFSLMNNGTRIATGMNPNAYGQVVGMGITCISASCYEPAYLELINITDSQIGYGLVPIKASLCITYVEQ